jgi:hypothetical protein
LEKSTTWKQEPPIPALNKWLNSAHQKWITSAQR